ncbi:glycosyltransferase [Mesobacillus foraminis]|uniref:glycosyltransferase family 2 protein n=1 Tax=Mesobacillus foraminis TaxID=279826 RepID=UPI0039A29AB4
MKPKVSIIVPVFNVEKYISRCLDSILNQSLGEIEIIAVNDGSTDSSLDIMKNFEAKDDRIKVINKRNGGVSSARNEGLSVAAGEFIGFVDPDDWVDENMYESLYKTAIENKAEIVMCSYIREFGSHSKEKDFNTADKVFYHGDEVRTKMMRRLVGPLKEEIGNPELLDAWGTVWSKLYSADLILKNGLCFSDLKEIGTNEDSLFNVQAFYYANSFCFINEPYYHYWRVNEGSVTTGYKPALFEQWFNLYNRLETFLEEKEMEAEYYQALNNRVCLNILGLGLNTISKSNHSPIEDKIGNLKSYLNDERIKRSFKQLELSFFPIVWKAFYFCAKARLPLGLYVMLMSIESLRKLRR